MRLVRTFLVLAAVVCSIPLAAYALTVRVESKTGNVTIRATSSSRIGYRPTVHGRPARPADLQVDQKPGLLTIVATPFDGAAVDIDVEIPYAVDVQASVSNGVISVDGFIRNTQLVTDSGEVHLRMPWAATRLVLEAQAKPGEVTTPKGYKFQRGQLVTGRWALRDDLPTDKVTYGRVEVRAQTLKSIVLEDAAIPLGFPVKLPWQAPELLDAIIAESGRRPAPGPAPSPNTSTENLAPDDGMPRFTSDVRAVNLTVAVSDAEGKAMEGLTANDFVVVEDGVVQQVSLAASDEVPFNLALLLDLSGSTQRNRPAMAEAAKQFVSIARPNDRVALYALANDTFHAVSHLTADHKELTSIIDSIPAVAGGSPIYDSIVLSYAEEFRTLPNQRNALIVISDGVDNQLYGELSPSNVSFQKLRRAASQWNALVYPIFLDPYTVAPPPRYAKRAREQMEELATASGGRLFVAQSINDLEGVYPQVAQELRSVYTVSYSSSNQNFDGKWRNVVVRVKHPGARVRTRDGYYAR